MRICRAGDHLSADGQGKKSDQSDCSPLIEEVETPRLTFENVEADPAQLVDVGVVDLGQEAHLRGRHRVFLGQEQLQLELSACRGHKYRNRRQLSGLPAFMSYHCLISPSNGLPPGPAMTTSKYLRLSSCGVASIPGAGSATSLSVS